jgi:hypothetical protein
MLCSSRITRARRSSDAVDAVAVFGARGAYLAACDRDTLAGHRRTALLRAVEHPLRRGQRLVVLFVAERDHCVVLTRRSPALEQLLTQMGCWCDL